MAAVAASGTVIAPLALPMMHEEAFIRYSTAIGMTPSVIATEHLKQSSLPQGFADIHGWPEMAAKIAKVYWSQSPQERSKAVFAGGNYGEAAAIDIYGSRLGLPPAISGHNNYWIWGPRGHDGSVVIEIGGTREQHLALFRSVEFAGWIESRYAMPYETHQPIWIERGMRLPMKDVWPKAKRYI